MEKKKELENLLVSVSENDDYAFRVFYDLYYRSVFRFAYYFLRNREACGEVVSNVFVAVWKSRVALRRIENIDAYLYVVARNEANPVSEGVPYAPPLPLVRGDSHLADRPKFSPPPTAKTLPIAG